MDTEYQLFPFASLDSWKFAVNGEICTKFNIDKNYNAHHFTLIPYYLKCFLFSFLAYNKTLHIN